MNKTYYLLLASILVATGCAKNEPRAATITASEPEAQVAASMSVDTALRAGVKLVAAAPGELHESLTLYGSIQADPDRVRQIAAHYPGMVRSVLHEMGDRVVAGEKLATVESSESLQTYAVVTPLAGIVTARHTNTGQVAGDAPLFEIADYSQVHAELSVFPRDRTRLQVGQVVHVVAADSEAAADGKIVYLSATSNNQAIVARVVVNNKDGRWTAGQFVTGAVVVDTVQAAVTIAPTALQQINGQTVVFVQNGATVAARSVELGKRAANAVEIKSGLQAGEMYAAENSYLVKAELLKNEAEEE